MCTLSSSIVFLNDDYITNHYQIQISDVVCTKGMEEDVVRTGKYVDHYNDDSSVEKWWQTKIYDMVY